MFQAGEDVTYPGMEFKGLDGKIDDVKSDGLVTAIASRFNTPDSPEPGKMPDIVHDGAFEESLAERKTGDEKLPYRVAHLFNHQWGWNLGSHRRIWEEKTIGLMAESRHNLETFWGREVFNLIKAGDIGRYSFQFLRRQNTAEKKNWEILDGVRHLYGLHLFELGPGSDAIAVHPGAVITDAKGMLYPDTHLPEMFSQAENVLSQLIEQVEALSVRREQEGRKAMTPDRVEKVLTGADKLEGLLKHLRDLTVVSEPDTSVDDREARERKSRSLLLLSGAARARAAAVLGTTLE